MGKWIGALIGMLFGPLGALFGFMIGTLFDARIKFTSNGFFSSSFFSNNIFFEKFPLLAAEITRSGGTQKTTVLTVKNIFIDLFGKQNAVIMMNRYKELVENGYSSYVLQQACDEILYNLDHQSKIYLVSTLFTVLKAEGSFSPQEIFAVQNISRSIGISGYEFENMLNRFKDQDFRSSAFNNSSSYTSNAYKTLELDQTASNTEIKKQYRALSKKHHPDMTSHLSQEERSKAEIKMREINNAYEELKKVRSIK